MIKKILKISLLILIVAIIGGYFYVTNIDWNKNKNVIASKFFDATGKKIVFSGPISLSFLPYPVLNASNVRVVNPNAHKDDAPLMNIKDLNCELEFLPFIKGQVNISLVSLSEPTINVIKNENAEINWTQEIDNSTVAKIKEENVRLSSVTLRNASFNFEDEISGRKINLKNLNAEVIAQSLLGPFNVDGSYVKDGQPSGFSLSVGELSNRFATNLNFAISYPKSQTSVRFDGNFLAENSTFNGDVFFATKQLKTFVDTNIADITLDDAYNHPLTFNFEVIYNKEKTSFENFVFEYGKSKGAGGLVIPHNIENADVYIPTIEANLNFTDLDATPLAYLIKNSLKKENFLPPLSFNLNSKFNALKTYYNKQTIEEFSFDLALKHGVFNIANLKATLPEGSKFFAGGEFLANEERKLQYSMNVDFKTESFYNILSWLKIAPYKYSETTYKNASVIAKIEGNQEQLKIFDIDTTIDKTKIGGNIGLILGERKNVLLALDFDSINVDEYILALSKEDKEKPFIEQLLIKLKNFSALNSFDSQIKAKANLLTFNGHTFEKVDAGIDVSSNNMTILNLSAKNFIDSEFAIAGVIKDFANNAMFENLKYTFNTTKFNNAMQTMGIVTHYIDTQGLDKLEAMGIASGYLENFNTKSSFKFEGLSYTFAGNVKEVEGTTYYDGNLELQASDFIKFVKLLGHNYKPKVLSLGTFVLNTKIAGKKDDLSFSETVFNIGNNNFSGNLNYKNELRPTIKADLTINKFDTKRFIYNPIKPNSKPSIFKGGNTSKTTFIKQPFYNTTEIDYDFYKTFDLDCELKINEFDVENIEIKNALFNLSIKDNIISVTNLNGELNGGEVVFDAKVAMDANPKLDGSISLLNQPLSPSFNLTGNTYGLKAKSYNVNNTAFSTSAKSLEDAFNKLSSDFKISLDGLVVKGFNLEAIENDLINRDTSENLVVEINKYLKQGEINIGKLDSDVSLKDGIFNFSNKIKLETQELDVKTTGSLEKWDIKLDANVNFTKSSYLEPYSFVISGNMNNPTVELNATKLVNMFDDRQEEFARQREQLKEQKVKRIKDAMTSIQQSATALSQEMIALRDNDIKIKQENSFDNNIKNNYQALLDKIEHNNTMLDKIFLQKNAVNVTEDKINELEDIKNQVKAELDSVKEAVSVIYVKDTINKIERSANEIKTLYDDVSEVKNQYLSTYNKSIVRLKEIESRYRILEDTNLNTFNSNIEDIYIKIDELYNNSQNDAKSIQSSDNIVLLVDTLKKENGYKQDIESFIKNINTTKDEAISYINEALQREEKIYEEKKRQEEIEKKIKENTATIAVEDKGVVTHKKDIEEIKKEEEIIKKDNLITIDFSKPQINKQPKLEPSKKEGVIIIKN